MILYANIQHLLRRQSAFHGTPNHDKSLIHRRIIFRPVGRLTLRTKVFLKDAAQDTAQKPPTVRCGIASTGEKTVSVVHPSDKLADEVHTLDKHLVSNRSQLRQTPVFLAN